MAPIREYLKLCRVEYSGFAYMAVLGALSVGGGNLRLDLVLWVAAVNVLTLMWTFAHNDYCDLAVDRQRVELDERVLVKGTVRPGEALWLIGTGIALALMLAWLATRALAPVLALLLSIALAMAYNKMSKRLFGADVLFAASATCLSLFGMLVAREQVGSVPPIAMVVLGIVFVEHLFFNMVEGGLKDADLDGRSGIDNLATRFIECSAERMVVSRQFKVIAFLLKLTAIGLAFVPVAFLGEPSDPVQLLLLALCSAMALFFLYRMTSMRRYDWQRMGFAIIRQEMAARSLLPLMLLPRIGLVWVIIIMMAPLTWYLSTVYFLHGRLFALPKRF